MKIAVMGRRRNGKLEYHPLDYGSRSRAGSVESVDYANQTMFASPVTKTAPVPTYSQSHSLKSEQVVNKEKFERMKKLVKHFAPAQFERYAYPTQEPCEIVPKNQREWAKHQAGMLEMKQADLKKNIDTKLARQSKDAKIPIGPAFAGKTFNDNRGAVLGELSIWCSCYVANAEHPVVEWPCRDDFLQNGDYRVKSGPTKCERFLPPLRVPCNETVSFDKRACMDQLPFDRADLPLVGYAQCQQVWFRVGEKIAEHAAGNADMNNDREFEEIGASRLGEDLMRMLGAKQERFIPEWLERRRLSQVPEGLIWEEDG